LREMEIFTGDEQPTLSRTLPATFERALLRLS
jgi:hypothetical protein